MSSLIGQKSTDIDLDTLDPCPTLDDIQEKLISNNRAASIAALYIDFRHSKGLPVPVIAPHFPVVDLTTEANAVRDPVNAWLQHWSYSGAPYPSPTFVQLLCLLLSATPAGMIDNLTPFERSCTVDDLATALWGDFILSANNSNQMLLKAKSSRPNYPHGWIVPTETVRKKLVPEFCSLQKITPSPGHGVTGLPAHNYVLSCAKQAHLALPETVARNLIRMNRLQDAANLAHDTKISWVAFINRWYTRPDFGNVK